MVEGSWQIAEHTERCSDGEDRISKVEPVGVKKLGWGWCGQSHSNCRLTFPYSMFHRLWRCIVPTPILLLPFPHSASWSEPSLYGAVRRTANQGGAHAPCSDPFRVPPDPLSCVPARIYRTWTFIPQGDTPQPQKSRVIIPVRWYTLFQCCASNVRSPWDMSKDFKNYEWSEVVRNDSKWLEVILMIESNPDVGK